MWDFVFGILGSRIRSNVCGRRDFFRGKGFEYLREKLGLLKVILSVQGLVANAKGRDTPCQK